MPVEQQNKTKQNKTKQQLQQQQQNNNNNNNDNNNNQVPVFSFLEVCIFLVTPGHCLACADKPISLAGDMGGFVHVVKRIYRDVYRPLGMW